MSPLLEMYEQHGCISDFSLLAQMLTNVARMHTVVILFPNVPLGLMNEYAIQDIQTGITVLDETNQGALFV